MYPLTSLVRMRSPVQIWLAAPRKSLEPQRVLGFLLFCAIWCSPKKPTRLYFYMQKSTMIANYDVKMGTFISRGMLCNKSNYPTLVLTSTGGIILYLKIIGFPEILNCFFVAFLVYAVAHSMVCAVSKQHRLFHCFIIYQEIAQLTLKAVSEKLTAFKG